MEVTSVEVERERLQVLHSCNLLDTDPEDAFDRICRLAAHTFATPIAAVSLVAEDRQFFKGIVGLEVRETKREVAFCAHTIQDDAPLVVLDARQDPRFSANELVTGRPGIRFYCGAPLKTPEGHRLGSVCVIDTEPRDGVPPELLTLLSELAAQASTEIDHRRTEEERVRMSAELRRGIASSCPVGIYQADLNGNVSYANTRVQEIWGVPEQELLGLGWTARVHPDDVASLVAGWTNANAEERDFEQEFRVLGPEGSTRWIHGRSSILRNRSGVPIGTIGTVDDISARKALEQEQHAHQELTRRILESSVDCIKVLDLEGRLMMMSPGGQRALGIEDVQPLIGLNYFELWKNSGDRRAAETAFQSACSGLVASFQGYFPGVNNKLRWWDTVFSPILDAQGRPGRILAVSRDLTEFRRTSEEQERAKNLAEHASRAKSMFLANASHELRTPLNGVLGTAELLLGTDLTAEQQDLAHTIKQSGTALLYLVNDLLDLSRAESGKLECKSVAFDLRKTVSQAVAMVRPAANEKRLELRVEWGESAVQHLLGDEDRLRQILVNYLANALKFTDRGTVTICVRTEGEQDGAPRLRISIHDTGCGIPMNAQPHLFTPFWQFDPSNTRRHGGLGLGLAIAARLAEMMGGSVGVESEVGEGSTFWVQLPLEVASSLSEMPVEVQMN